IGQAAQIYISDNNGYLPGGGATSGRFFYPEGFLVNASPLQFTNGNIPGDSPMYPSDYFAPLIMEMRLSWKSHADPNGADRLFEYVNMPEFQCPSYVGTLIHPNPNTGAWAGTIPAPSYVTAWAFLLNAP